jgi:SAM-dependent MidA family methyltransferase
MELALYCPVYGYYEKERDSVGRRGDFFTSVSVGGLFGQLLAFEFAAWLEGGAVDHQRVFLVEAGAHNGRLAADILRWLRGRRPRLFEQVDYVVVEPSARRRQWQQRRLKEFGARVRWVERLEALAPEGVRGMVFSNELLDAMPVRRLGWDAGTKSWYEWGVAMRDERFAWIRLPTPAEDDLPPLPEPVRERLPDRFVMETCPAAQTWWRTAAGILRCGRLLTFDYGYSAEGLIDPARAEGTLRAYRRHHLQPDVLADPGELDMTAHVNFSAVRAAGEDAGLRTEFHDSQERFLTRIAQRAWGAAADFGDWTSGMTRQFQTLTHPEHLGRVFQVLVQSRP